MLNKKILIASLVIMFMVVIFLGLNYSQQFNHFIFSKIINPYNPLLSKVPQNKVSQITNEEIDTLQYWRDPRDLFPIFAYNVPENTKNLSASLKIIEKGGINIIINSNIGWIADADKVKKAFEKLGDTNLKWIALIENECKDDFIFRNSNDETNIQIKDYLRTFNDYHVYGWYIWDEPGSNRKPCTPFNIIPNDDNADINTMVKQIRSDSTFNKKLDYVNLFPAYWDSTPDAADYEKYIDAFVSSQEFKPRVLCFDHYPLLKSEFSGFRKDYYSNLVIIRKKSIEYNIPFWMIVLSSEHDYYKNPTFEEISLQVYSALAYGAKGIGYYLYSKGWENLGYRSWILEYYVDDSNVADSLHGPLFVPVQNLNNAVQVLGKILGELESVDIIHTSDYPNKQKDIVKNLFKKNEPNNLLKEILITEDQNADPKILIGVFEDKKDTIQNGRYLLVVNKDVLTSSEFQIKLNKTYKLFKFNKETGEKNFLLPSENIIITIFPGSGELFYIE